MAVFWNVGYTTTPTGDSQLLEEFRPVRACRFRVRARVPRFPPGTYPINVIVYSNGSWGPFLPVRFRLVE